MNISRQNILWKIQTHLCKKVSSQVSSETITVITVNIVCVKDHDNLNSNVDILSDNFIHYNTDGFLRKMHI